MTLTDLAVITLVMAGAVVLLHSAHVAYRDAQVGFFVVLVVTANLYLVGAEWLHLQP